LKRKKKGGREKSKLRRGEKFQETGPRTAI